MALTKMKFTPYRGEKEKVTKVYSAEVILYENHLQLNLGYDYQEEGQEKVLIRLRALVHRNTVSINQSIAYKVTDKENESPNNIIQINYAFEPFWLFATAEECNKLFEFISKWMLKA